MELSGQRPMMYAVVLASVVIISVVGWFGWHVLRTSSIDGKQAEVLVSNFYEQYADFSVDHSVLVRQYGTDALVKQYNDAGSDPHGAGSDPIICAQGLAPISVTGHSTHGSSVDVTVSEAFEPVRTLTVRVVGQDGSLKIDHVTCP